MFWQWNEEFKYMEYGEGEHVSQWEKLSQRLLSKTFWGDYNGDIYNRALYTEILANNPDIVESIEAGHGQGLILKHSTESYRPVLDALLEFEEGYFENYWETIDQLFDDEVSKGWTGQWIRERVIEEIEKLTDWEGIETVVPAQGTPEFWDMFRASFDKPDEWYPAWEGATDLLLEGLNPEKSADFVLSTYAAGFNVTQDVELPL